MRSPLVRIVLLTSAIVACSSSSATTGDDGGSATSQDASTSHDGAVASNDAASSQDANGSDATQSGDDAGDAATGDASLPPFDGAAPGSGMANCELTFDSPSGFSGTATPLTAPFIQASASGFAGGMTVTCSTGARTMMIGTAAQTVGSYPAVPEGSIQAGQSFARYAEGGITWDSNGGSVSIDSVNGKTLAFTVHAAAMSRTGTAGDTFVLNGQGVATLP